MTVFLTACKEKKNLAVPKTNAQIELDKTRDFLEEMGEVNALDTTKFKKIIYQLYSYPSGLNIISIRDLKFDTIATVTNSHAKFSLLYDSDTSEKEKLHFYLKAQEKTTHTIAVKNKNNIFIYLDSLIKRKLLLPIGQQKISDSDRQVGCNGWNTLLYYNGIEIFKYEDYYSNEISMDSLSKVLEQNINFDEMWDDFNHSL
jgi:hypothetical protein